MCASHIGHTSINDSIYVCGLCVCVCVSMYVILIPHRTNFPRFLFLLLRHFLQAIYIDIILVVSLALRSHATKRHCIRTHFSSYAYVPLENCPFKQCSSVSQFFLSFTTILSRSNRFQTFTWLVFIRQTIHTYTKDQQHRQHYRTTHTHPASCLKSRRERENEYKSICEEPGVVMVG